MKRLQFCFDVEIENDEQFMKLLEVVAEVHLFLKNRQKRNQDKRAISKMAKYLRRRYVNGSLTMYKEILYFRLSRKNFRVCAREVLTRTGSHIITHWEFLEQMLEEYGLKHSKSRE